MSLPPTQHYNELKNKLCMFLFILFSFSCPALLLKGISKEKTFEVTCCGSACVFWRLRQVRLTRSKDGSNGTAFFVFTEPDGTVTH